MLVTYLVNSCKDAIFQIMNLFLINFILAYAMFIIADKIRYFGGRNIRNYFYFVAPGVVCHETGHALGCILAGYKIKEFVPFKPVLVEGGVRLGYVSYEPPKTLVSKVGLLFVGTGPIWFGGIVVLLICSFVWGTAPFESICEISEIPHDLKSYLILLLSTVCDFITNFVYIFQFDSILDFVSFYLIFCIATETKLSDSDLVSMIVGLIAICILLLVGNIIPYSDMLIDYGFNLIQKWIFIFQVILAFSLFLLFCFYVIFVGGLNLYKFIVR